MPSLTRIAARARSAAVTVDDYEIALDLTATDSGLFTSRTTIRFGASARQVLVDVAAHHITSAVLNGRSLDVATGWDANESRLTLDGLEVENELIVDAVMSYSHDGEGLHRHVDPADGRTYLYAMSFLDAAPRWFACFDQPDLKAPVSMDVRCPPDWRVAGNGPAHEVAPGHWRLRSTGPLATYFTTLVAGPYHEVRARHDSVDHDGIAMVLYSRQSLAAHLDRDAEELFDHTRRCFDELHRLFGVRYPWGEYHQAFVPEFNAGAMENPGCVTLTDKLVFRSRATDAERADRAVTIAHEMAHMWFGDLVTMRWWDDLWLNESFAEYLGHRICGEQTWTAFGIERKAWGYAADRRPSTHPVAGNGAVDTAAALAEFDGISYAKGASVLRQLSAHLGDEVFLAGLRTYISAHAHGNAEFADLIGAWTDVGAVGLGSWTTAWLRTSGLDSIAAAGNTITLRSAGEPRPHTFAVAQFDASAHELRRDRVTVDAGRPDVEVADDGVLVLPDADDETWAKISLSAQDWAALPRLLPMITDARARGVLWNAMMLSVADAELDPRLAFDIVTAGLPVESDTAIARVGSWAARTLLGSYGTGSDPQGLVRAMLGVAELDPGSGRQLAAARVAIATTHDETWLREWLGGVGLPAGLTVDVGLAWAIRLRLTTLGALADGAIASALADDRSTDGAMHAARCRAARPDPDAKEAAWRALMTDVSMSNHELYALAEGFWQPNQAALVDPYAARYFDEIAGTARLRSGWVAARLALLAYPWPVVTVDTLAATDRALGSDALPTNLRRSVVDAGDDLRRALASRTRFATGASSFA